VVPKYLHDWWNLGPEEYKGEFGLRDIEEAYQFHVKEAQTVWLFF
jgi:hypothetical protein